MTGTPIIGEGYNTKDIFGDYIHTYYYNASISDGYTLRLIREDIGSNFKITMKEALNSIRVKKQTVKEIDVYAHENYVHPLLDYIINDLQDFRSKYSDPSLGALAVCNSKEQAIMMYRLFLENYADDSELDNYTGEDGQIIYRSISANEMEVKKTSPQKDVIALRLSCMTVLTNLPVPNGLIYSKTGKLTCSLFSKCYKPALMLHD